jgi:hypothetical protein
MQTFEYVDKSGTLKTVQAADATSAMSSATDRMATSGVALKTTPVVQDTSATRKQGKDDAAALAREQARAERQRKRNEASSATTTSTTEDGGIYDGVETEAAKAKQTIDRTYDPLIKKMEQARVRASETAAAGLDNIRETFELRKQEMAETNRKELQYEESVGLRSSTGRSRYAPKMQQQILTDEEQRGILRISDLDTQMNTLLIKAEQAQDAQDLQALQSIMKAYKEKNDMVNEEISNLYTRVKEEENARIARNKEERDAIAAETKQNEEKAATLAPSLKQYLDQIPTQAGKEEFISKYAKEMGITEEEYLFAALEEYGVESTKNALDIESKRQSISNSRASNARASASEQRANEKANEYQIDVENIVQGASKLSDVSSANKSKVTNDLRQLGYFKTEPPVWFKDKIEGEEGVNLPYNTLQSKWETHRKAATE